MSLFGDLRYPAGFKHFEYVNPAAPKRGTVRLIAVGTFDNFNHRGLGRQRASSPPEVTCSTTA